MRSLRPTAISPFKRRLLSRAGRRTNSKGRIACSSRGVTLIEIMVALVIAALLFSAASIGVGALQGSKARQAASELSASLRALYDRAGLMGKTCRMVFSMPAENSEEPAAYWAECAAGNITTRREQDEGLVSSESSRRAKDKKRSEPRRDKQPQTPDELMAEEEDRVERLATFAEFQDEILAKRKLPSAVKLELWTPHQKDVQTAGKAFLYFYPQGFTERALVKVRQGDHTWTIKLSPLSGKADVVAEDLEIPRS